VGLRAQQVAVAIPELTNSTCGSTSLDTASTAFGPFASSTTRWFDVESFKFGSTNKAPLGTATTESKPALLPIDITKRVDACSPAFLRAISNLFSSGGPGAAGAIYVKELGATAPTLLVRFEGATIVSSRLDNRDFEKPTEKLSLNVVRISYTYFLRNAAGFVITTVCYGYNLATRTAWTAGCPA